MEVIMNKRIFAVLMTLFLSVICLFPVETSADVASVLSGANPSFHLAENQVNEVYFQSIGAGQSVKFQQTFYIEKALELMSVPVQYNLRYFNSSGKEYANATTFSPQVTIPCRLKINNISVASNAYIGSRCLVNVRLTNDGTIDISNIKMIVDGNVPQDQQTFDIGALKAGEHIMKDCSVNFLKEGTQKLKIDFEYTDESGITYTLDTKTYSVSVSGSKPSESNSSSSNHGLKLGNRRINFFSSFFIIFFFSEYLQIYFL